MMNSNIIIARANGSQPKCNIEVAFQEGVTCAMATESYLKGKRIEWDPVNRRLI